MTRIVFIAHDGTRSEVEAANGQSVMQAAVRHNVEGIIAECGGAGSCATCHCVVDAAWWDRLPPPGPDEEGMLPFTVDTQAHSRLSCQMRVEAALDGLVVRIPVSQF